MPRPVQPPDGGRVHPRQQRQQGVEVVLLPQEFHHLDQLEDEALTLLGVGLQQDAGSGIGRNVFNGSLWKVL